MRVKLDFSEEGLKKTVCKNFFFSKKWRKEMRIQKKKKKSENGLQKFSSAFLKESVTCTHELPALYVAKEYELTASVIALPI